MDACLLKCHFKRVRLLYEIAISYLQLKRLCTSLPAAGQSRTVVQSHHYGTLCEQLRQCAASWKKVAEGLRFHKYEISNIAADPMKIAEGAPESYMDAVISGWLDWGPGDVRGSEDVATLEALRVAVIRAGFVKVAGTLTLNS